MLFYGFGKTGVLFQVSHIKKFALYPFLCKDSSNAPRNRQSLIHSSYNDCSIKNNKKQEKRVSKIFLLLLLLTYNDYNGIINYREILLMVFCLINLRTSEVIKELDMNALEEMNLDEMDVSQLQMALVNAMDENKKLRKIVANYESDDYIEDDEALVNRIVEERLAEEDRINDERAADDPDFAWELRQIRYMESRYDDDYGW